VSDFQFVFGPEEVVLELVGIYVVDCVPVELDTNFDINDRVFDIMLVPVKIPHCEMDTVTMLGAKIIVQRRVHHTLIVTVSVRSWMQTKIEWKWTIFTAVQDTHTETFIHVNQKLVRKKVRMKRPVQPICPRICFAERVLVANYSFEYNVVIHFLRKKYDPFTENNDFFNESKEKEGLKSEPFELTQ
jgi:hypothetical protein